VGLHEVDTKGVKKSGGDFNKGELAARASVDATVDGIAAEAVEILNKENRKAVLFFCVTIEHAEKMGKALSLLGIEAPAIHSKTPDAERSALVRRFGAGQIRGLCNVNVLSEGFDAQRIDAVVMIRPTESKGLYYQQVGRGLRIHPDKKDCLVLDFAGNIGRHGPIDVMEGEKPEMITCGADLYCREHFPMPLGRCPACGWIIPPPPPMPVAPRELAPRIIPSDPRARSEAAILSDAKPWEMVPLTVSVTKHEKAGKPPSLCVQYQNGYAYHREWVCLEHDGYARHKAQAWWKSRFGEPVPATVDQALAEHMFIETEILAMTASVTVRQAWRYTEIINVRLKTRDAVGK
jgi:DNA repair protein RadD